MLTFCQAVSQLQARLRKGWVVVTSPSCAQHNNIWPSQQLQQERARHRGLCQDERPPSGRAQGKGQVVLASRLCLIPCVCCEQLRKAKEEKMAREKVRRRLVVGLKSSRDGASTRPRKRRRNGAVGRRGKLTGRHDHVRAFPTP